MAIVKFTGTNINQTSNDFGAITSYLFLQVFIQMLVVLFQAFQTQVFEIFVHFV